MESCLFFPTYQCMAEDKPFPQRENGNTGCKLVCFFSMLITLLCTICAEFVIREIERTPRSCVALPAVAFAVPSHITTNLYPKSRAESLSSIMSSHQMTPVKRRRSHGGF
jgi:hypothetical protein